jgi:defect-in-organelle-trafficking protein DotB
MRRAPTIMLIGEVRDKESIDAAIEAALTGHKCYTTTHTSSVGEVVSRLMSAYGGEEQNMVKDRLISCAHIFIVQKLLKTATGRVAAREWIEFSASMKESILTSSEPPNVYINMICREQGTSMAHYCKYLFDCGEVDLKVAAMGANMKQNDFLEVVANHDLFAPYRRQSQE